MPVPERSRSVRIKDVAERAQVSVATVSRVLNGDPKVDPELGRRVRAAVGELGYRPNRLARNLRRQHMEALGIVVPDIENPHFAEVVRVIEVVALTAGYRVLVCNTDEDGARQKAYLSMLADERVSGIILSPSDPDGSIGELGELGIPVVTIDRALKRAATDLIVADGGFRRDAARTAVRDLLGRPDPPSALVVANNLMALGALQAIRDCGLRVPGDISVIAVDNPDWAELLDPPLTVLAQPIRPMATQAAELLIRRATGEEFEPVHQVYPLELIIRGSCGTAQH